jgi:hypothetical protein
MELSIEKIRHAAFKLHLDTGFDFNDIQTALDSEDWIPYSQTGLSRGHVAYATRFKKNRPESEVLRSILTFLRSDDIKRKYIETFYATHDPYFESIWCMKPDEMMSFVDIGADLVLDRPGFEIDIHVDNRMLVSTGWIYLTPRDDPEWSTYFYFDREKTSDPIRMTTNPGDGWLNFNDFNTWHDGYNRTEENRYGIILSLSIKHPREYNYRHK